MVYRKVDIGPRTRMQLRRLGRVWEQGQHIFVSGSTGSGKTMLTRHIIQLRLNRGGHVVVFCAKPLEDETITKDYADFTRWKTWKRNPSSFDRKILLWPDVSRAKGERTAILDIQKQVFGDAFAGINGSGKYTVQIDEGLYTVHPQFLGMSGELSMSHAIGRSGELTMVTLAQRPSHLPLLLYGSASHAFVGRTREAADKRRLAELGSLEGSNDLSHRIANQGRHDFLWVPVAEGWPAEKVNLAE